MKKDVSAILKEFELSDDQILNIAICDTLGAGVNLLREYIGGKWRMDTITAMKTVKKLKDELS